METIDLNLPDFWATALFYDDVSGFEYEDEKPFKNFVYGCKNIMAQVSQ